jgi:hypothetical protein
MTTNTKPIALAELVRQGTTPDERALIASQLWSQAKRAVHFATTQDDRVVADADRATALRLYRQARRDAPASRAAE